MCKNEDNNFGFNNNAANKHNEVFFEYLRLKGNFDKGLISFFDINGLIDLSRPLKFIIFKYCFNCPEYDLKQKENTKNHIETISFKN